MNMTRREVLRDVAATGMLFTFGCAGGARNRAAALGNGAKIRVAFIGCGERARVIGCLKSIVNECELIALCDPDPKAISDFRAACSKPAAKLDGLAMAKAYADYREMFGSCADKLDAVFVATPNHHHALCALMAMRHGLHAFVEAPLAHTLEEANLIARLAKTSKSVLRVDHAGRFSPARALLAQHLKSGIVGNVNEIFCFTDRTEALKTRPVTSPAPKDMNWDLWCGGSAVCEPYSAGQGRLGMHPGGWRGWVDYGNGTVGGNFANVLDVPFHVLDITTPSDVLVNDVEWGCKDAWNTGCSLDFTIPAHKDRGAMPLHYADGAKASPALLELAKKWGAAEALPREGAVIAGTKGMAVIAADESVCFFPRGGSSANLPAAKQSEMQDSAVAEFLSAVRGRGGAAYTTVESVLPLTKTILLANSVVFAGKGSYSFDGVRTDSSKANAKAKATYRSGWELAQWSVAPTEQNGHTPRDMDTFRYGPEVRGIRGTGMGARSSGFGALER